jgi:hypothetical protein
MLLPGRIGQRPLPNPLRDKTWRNPLPFRDTRHHLLPHQQSHAMQQCASKRSIVRRDARLARAKLRYAVDESVHVTETRLVGTVPPRTESTL